MWDSLDPRSVDSRDREPDDPRAADSVDPRDVFTRDLDLPRGLERERVHLHGHDYDLRGSEVRMLATIAQNEQSRVMETFLTNPSADEVDIAIQNVSLSELAKPPYKASVSFQKVLYTPGTRAERGRETYVAQLDFVMRDHVPNEFVRVNPLGLQITYFRVDQAFEESRR